MSQSKNPMTLISVMAGFFIVDAGVSLFSKPAAVIVLGLGLILLGLYGRDR